MSLGRETTELLDRLSTLDRQQGVSRLAVLGGSLLFLAIVSAAGGGFHPLISVAVLAVALAAAALPESHAPLGLLLLLGGGWAWLVPRSLDGWLLLAATDLLAVHLACLLASYGPSGTVLDRELLGRWRQRFLLCVAVTAGVWLVARAIDFLDLPASDLVLVAALGVALAWVTFLSVVLSGRDVPRA